MSPESHLTQRLIPDNWTVRLTEALAVSLREFASQIQGTEILMLQMTCLPWHGLLSLAILTTEDAGTAPSLNDPMTTMDWKYGEFTEEVEAWRLTTPLAQEMRAADNGSTDCPATAVAFLQACAEALSTTTVAEAVNLVKRADGFRISVPHPDNRREFFPPQR